MRVIVIGAGPAGLAAAACAGQAGHAVTVFERADRVGAAWHGHYDRLHLHTPKSRSGLPYLPMPDDFPRYPSRAQVIDYLERYADHFAIAPVFGAEVRAVRREGAGWYVRHAGGGAEAEAEAVIFATGLADRPHWPTWPGLESFPGPMLHSSSYRRPDSVAGRRVLVVGFGNSGGEIALDLAEAGREVDIVVRRPVNLLPKELFGIPIVSLGLLQKILPYRVADAITAPLLTLAMGDYGRYGLRKAAKGPVAQVREDGRVPLIDTGTLAKIRDGVIGVRPGIARIVGDEITFTDGVRAHYDALMLATGYEVDLRPILGRDSPALDALGRPLASGGRSAAPGLYFCSYRATPNGQLRTISQEARAIAADLEPG
ncbi:flavin-containing monooxygenase [Acidimangrovimonas pyrenivorans]|uniref:Trimethylamine monooxygenase n=1 Tax=Acidimangrovimonas pyrenivorans TaxID=2030798 RepID=A0ABV7AHZ8_9RHOB